MVQVKAAVHVDEAEDIGRPRSACNRLLPEGRELVVTVRDLLLVFSEPAARWLLAMLAAIVAPESEADGMRGSTVRETRTPATDGLALRITVGVCVYRPADVGRPRWDGCELIVSVGTLVLVLSGPAAKWLLDTLAGTLAASGEPDSVRSRSC